MVLFGLVLGLFIPAFPYPRIALTAHIGLTGNGALLVAMGCALAPSVWPFAFPGRLRRQIIRIGCLSAWIVPPAQIINAFWGSKTMLPMAAAGSPGAPAWQNTIIDLAHMIPGFMLIASFGCLVSLIADGTRQDGGTKKTD